MVAGGGGKRSKCNRKARRQPLFEVSALERRLFLAAQPSLSTLISTFSWAKVNPQLEALTIQSEQSDPRFAMLFNADLARAGLPPIPAVSPSNPPAAATGGTLTPSLVVRTGEHLLRKPLTHKPAVHKPKPHRPLHKLHKPLHKPIVHKPKPGHHLLHGSGSGIHLSHFTSTLPVVTGSSFVYDTGRLPQQLVFTFNETVAPVTSWPISVNVQDVTNGATLALAASNFTFNPSANTLTINLTSTQLPDGNYVATLFGGQIADSSGNKLAGSDGTPGDPYNYNFFILAGDCNHDGIVNNADYLIFKNNYLKTQQTWSGGDFNYDDTVNNFDYAMLKKNYGTIIAIGLPSNLQVTASAATSASLSWTAATDSTVTSYDIIRNGQFLASVSGTTFTDTGLSASTGYTYAVESVNSTNNFSPPTASVSVHPVAPSNLSTTTVSASEIDLAWTLNSSDATSVQVLRSIDGTNFSVVTTIAGTATSYNDTSLSENTPYYYEITTVGGGTSTSAPAVGITLPAVNNLTATAASTSEIDLAWTGNAANITGYEIDRSTDGANWSVLSNVPASTLTYKDTGLPADTTYYYQVRASRPSGPSAYCPSTAMSTLALPPTGLSATLNGSEIDLSWSAASANDSGFTLDRSTDGVSFSAIGIPSDSGTTYILDPSTAAYHDADLIDGTTYYYRVHTDNAGGSSSPSPVASVTIPLPAPTGLAAAAFANSQSEIDLTWTNTSSGASSVTVKRSTDGSNFSTIATLPTPLSTYADTGLSAGTKYYYLVQYSNSSATSPTSSIASATTAPGLSLSDSGGASEGQTYTVTIWPVYSGANPITALTMDWGDGTPSSPDVQTLSAGATSATHTYSEGGSYTVTATAQSAAGATTATLAPFFSDPSPSLSITTPSSPVPQGSAATITQSLSVSPADTVTSETIDWGDGSTQVISGAPPSSVQHIYLHGNGSAIYYVVSAAVTTSDGVAQALNTIPVSGPQVQSGNPVTITPPPATEQSSAPTSMTVDWSAPAGPPPSQFTLDFGDGTSATAAPIQDQYGEWYYPFSHSYAEEGTYYLYASGSGFGNWGFINVSDPGLTIDPISDQSIVTGTPLSISTTVHGLDPSEKATAFIDWGDGRAEQKISLKNNGDGTGTVTGTLSNLQPGDYAPLLSVYDQDGNPFTAGFHVHSHYVLDADLDNNDGFGVPNSTPTEMALRSKSGNTGKYVQVNSEDLNGDGIPDYAEGFNSSAPPTAAQGAAFVPITITLPANVPVAGTTISFNYSGSDPAQLTRTGSGTRTDPYLYHPATGDLRIWTKDEPATRNQASVGSGGNYVKPNETFNASSLTWSVNRNNFSVATLYVEGIAPSASVGAEKVQVTLTNGGQSFTDSVPLTALFSGIAVDANRDGTIKFDGSDRTTASAPYRFWLNDNHDVLASTSANGYQYDSIINDGQPDYQNGKIHNQGDLQDFAHLQIQVPLGATDGHGVLSPGWSLYIQYVATSGIPVIKLLPLDQSYATGLLTYMTDSTAVQALGGAVMDSGFLTGGAELTDAAGPPVETKMYVASGSESANPSGGNGALNYLFEGAAGGSGAVVVRWKYNGVTLLQSSFSLQLMPINQFYEHWSVGDTTSWGDLRDPKTPAIPSIATTSSSPSAIQFTRTSDSGTYAAASPEDKQVIVYVNGWRMVPNERRAFADTAFKRLYWQGYTGRFVLFSWPTDWVDTGSYLKAIWDHKNFDRSEQRALSSAAGLYSLLQNLDQQYGYQNVDMFAHSMGNIVASEALRLAATAPNPAPLVNSYVASQTAFPAEAYDPSVPVHYFNRPPSTPDIYTPFPPTGKAYFAPISAAATTLWNFYNPNDYALGKWQVNEGFKPDVGYTYDGPVNRAGFFIGAGNFVRKGGWFNWNGGNVNLSLVNPLQRYEAMSYVAQSESLALGAQPGVKGVFASGGTLDLSNLGTQPGVNFNATPADHSAEFLGTDSSRQLYWNAMLKDFNVSHWSNSILGLP